MYVYKLSVYYFHLIYIEFRTIVILFLKSLDLNIHIYVLIFPFDLFD